MKFADHLRKQQRKQLEDLKKSKENLSRRDLEDLMGTRRDTFKRVRGAVRRK